MDIEKKEEFFYQTEEEISLNYDKVMETCLKQDCSSNFLEIIEELKKIENSIRKHDMFSPNEGLKDVPDQHLKYLLLPYFMADSFKNIQANRFNNIVISQKYYNEFLKLMNHYEMVSQEQKEIWKNLDKDMNYELSREYKLGSFKEQKETMNKLNYLKESKKDQNDTEIQRELVTYLYKLSIMTSITELRMGNQEHQILEYKQSIEKDSEAKSIHDAREKLPVPPLKYYHIPKPQVDEQSYMFSTHQAKKMDNQALNELSSGIYKEEVKDRVWQPGHGLPEERLDDFADREIARMQERSEQQVQKNLSDEDSENEEIADRKQMKAREWDDWKDEHEKGAGNKNKGQ